MTATAVILAAGCGSRLYPRTADRPKCLTELGGTTLIDRQIRTLNDAGIADIVVVTGYLAERLTLLGVHTVHNARWLDTNMVESLFAAEAEFGSDLIVAYGDIVYESRVLAALLASRHDISVIVDRSWREYWERRFDDPLSDAESLRLDSKGRILDIGGEASDIAAIEGQYIGLMRFQGAGIATLRRAKSRLGQARRPWMAKRPVAKAFMTDLLMEMALAGDEVFAVPVDGGWLEIDSERDLVLAIELIAAAPVGALRPTAA